MAVDLGIGTVATTLNATDPEFLRSDAFKRQVMMIVREELERDRELDERRKRDMRGLREDR